MLVGTYLSYKTSCTILGRSYEFLTKEMNKVAIKY